MPGMFTLRTRFAKDIVAEFLPPMRPVKRQRVVILCDGMPSVLSKRPILDFFARKGYWVFHPRYRGTWESGGMLFSGSPDRDLIDVIAGLSRPFYESFGGRKFRLNPKSITLVASSFGGAAAILASRDKRVTRVIAASPVVDWTAKSKAEDLGFLEKFVADAFGMGYRIPRGAWKKLKSGKFFNPVNHTEEIDGSKLLIIHAKDDDVVAWRPVARFAKAIGANLRLISRGGHLGLGTFTLPKFYKTVSKFLK